MTLGKLYIVVILLIPLSIVYYNGIKAICTNIKNGRAWSDTLRNNQRDNYYIFWTITLTFIILIVGFIILSVYIISNHWNTEIL